MTRLIAGLAALVTAATALGADDSGGFAGEWKTTLGSLTLDQKGDAVTRRPVFYKLAGARKSSGKGRTLGYDEGQVHVDATATLDPSGLAFKGTLKGTNGFRNVLSGWRPDPAAAKSEPADFSGLWL